MWFIVWSNGRIFQIIYVSRRLNFFSYYYFTSKKISVERNRRRALNNVTASLCYKHHRKISVIPHAINSCVKKERMETDRYCSSVVHLLCGRELGFRNALTGNAKWCAKHKILQTCDNINDCDVYYDDCVYLYLATCHCVIRGFRDQNYSELHVQMSKMYFYMIHICSMLLKNVRISILK